MELVQRDGGRVTKKLDSVPEDERKMLERRQEIAGAAGPAAKESIVPAVLAGFVHGFVVMMSFGSFAITIFGQSEHKELRDALSLAVSQQVLSASVLIGILTFSGFFPFTMGGPTPPAALLIADVVKSVVDSVSDPEKKVPTALLTIAIVSLLMGVMLVLISATKTTVYALQLPYPVLCGFLGSVGVLLVRNSFGILLNIKLKWCFVPADMAKAKALDPAGVVCQLGLGILVAATLLQGVPRVRAKMSKKAGLSVLPVLFLLPLVAFYCAVLAGGLDMGIDSELRNMNPPWLNKSTTWSWSPRDFFVAVYDVARWDLAAIFSGEAIMRMFLSAFLCVIAALINMAGIEVNAPQRHSLDLDKEFMSLGRANIVVGLLGGHPGHHVAAFSLPMKKDGGTTRLAPWTASGLWFAAFLSAAPLTAVVPRFFFGGCFLQVGFGLARTFLWDNRGGLDRASICISLITVLTAVFTDLNIACGTGFLLVGVNFVRLSMNVQVVRAVERADMRRAPKYRTGKEIEHLNLYGHKVMVLYLEGYLFWGTVDEITGAFEDLIDGTDDDPEIIFVDMRYVTGIELSVINTFKKLARLAGNVGIKVKLCSLPSANVIGPALRKLLETLPFACNEDLCSLMEKCEDDLLDTFMSKERPAIKKLLICRTANGQIPDEDSYWRGKTFRSWKAWCLFAREEAKLRRSPAKQAMLVGLVEATGCSYGMLWESIGDGFAVSQTHYTSTRAQQLVQVALKDKTEIRTYVMASTRLTLGSGDSAMDSGGSAMDGEGGDNPDQDVLVRAWVTQKIIFCNDVTKLPGFRRRDLARGFDIRKCIFVPTANSVIELGAAGEDELFLESVNPVVLDVDPATLVNAATPEILRTVSLESLRAAFGDAGDLAHGQPGEPAHGPHLSAWRVLVAPTRTAEGALLGDRLSWNLLLAISALGSHRYLTKEDQILVQPCTTGHIITSDATDEMADDIFIVLQGTFGTFRKNGLSESEEMDLVIKSPPGTILGADDVWAHRPRSVQLRCLTDEGQVVALSRRAVKAIEMCDSPLLTSVETAEFIDFMKREMSLNMSIVMCAFSNPERR